ncbi:hypothetical protein E2C01_046010 [Portunus trituberculatus]|uniref:Uncharacterized protein n=1 Tax=Portunus trituberculatus TaxID=210409 RepID=A0A5B7G3M7_PORTR|nr:hypothetical protein [Portunus trituberculatus]
MEALNRSEVTWETLIASTVPAEVHPAPPWEEYCITTIVNPPRRRKNLCVQAELRQEGLHSISDAQGPRTATYFTDGSTGTVTGRSGLAYVCKIGDEGAAAVTTTTTTITASARTSDFSSSTQTELAAIGMALDHAHTSHHLNVLVATDSMTAIAAINKPGFCPPHTRHSPSRLCEVVTSRIRLGY